MRVWSTLDYKKSFLATCRRFHVDCSKDRRRELIQIVRSISWLGLILEFCTRRLGEAGQFAYISFKGREKNILVSKGQLESETQSHTDNVAWQCQLWYLPNRRCLAQKYRSGINGQGLFAQFSMYICPPLHELSMQLKKKHIEFALNFYLRRCSCSHRSLGALFNIQPIRPYMAIIIEL